MQIVELQPRLKSSSRNGRAVSTITVHSTAGGSVASSVAYLRKPNIKASYHYLIERDGVITKAVDIGQKAWHAGVSVGPEGKDVNPYSVGIAFANRNDGIEQITFAQIEAASQLVDALCVAMPTIKYVTTHYGVSYPRKSDARGFDLKKFVEHLPLANKPKAWIKPGAPWKT